MSTEHPFRFSTGELLLFWVTGLVFGGCVAVWLEGWQAGHFVATTFPHPMIMTAIAMLFTVSSVLLAARARHDSRTGDARPGGR